MSALQYRRFDFFNTLHYGHMANYHSPGTFHATEQLGEQPVIVELSLSLSPLPKLTSASAIVVF